jgi:hypothetical protein
LKTAKTTSLAELDKNQFNVFPNPVKAGKIITINFNAHEAGTINIKVINDIGNVILEEKIQNPVDGKNTIQLNTQKLSLGTYILQITDYKNITNKIKKTTINQLIL